MRLLTKYGIVQIMLLYYESKRHKLTMNYNYNTDYFEADYCQSVLDASSLDNNKHYVLSDVNVVKLLHDHGANVNEWKEDCKRFNDPEEILLWLGY